jgi:alkylated DNA repair dioxygenase AlkB
MADQLSLFAEYAPDPLLPEGVRYSPEAISALDEKLAIQTIESMKLKPFSFQGFEGKRRVTSFGWHYDFNKGGLKKSEPMPAVFLSLRDKVAKVANIKPQKLEQLLVTEYAPGAGIGWHRDRPQFGKIVAVSLQGTAKLRFRKRGEAGWQRLSRTLLPRSIYVLDGPGRNDWEHSIPAVEELRYSLTFRTMR